MAPEVGDNGVGGGIDANTVLENTGGKDLVLVYNKTTTIPVPMGKSKTLTANGKTPIQVQADSKTIATINYPDGTSFSVAKGVQVPTATFTLKIPVSD